MKRHKTKPDKDDIATDASPPKTANWSRRICVSAAFILFFAVFISFASNIFHYDRQNDMARLYNDKPEVMVLFKKYDRNDDGVLDIHEFEPIGLKVLAMNVTPEFSIEIADDDEFITINANFEPIQIDSLSKDLNTGYISNPESLKFLKQWKSPYKEQESFGCRDFKKFLPDDPDKVQLGKVWNLIKKLENRGAQLSSNRFFPPEPSENEITIYRLLQMFHKRPFVFSRFEPQGTALTVRAKNEKFLDIVFRIHAEYQINEPPYHPFWYTPGKFIGRIIIAKDASHIEYFNMHLPTDKKLNIDMEWLNGPEGNMEVDIGFMPKMELSSSEPSLEATLEYEDPVTQEKTKFPLYKSPPQPMPQAAYEKKIKSIKWSEEISMETALSNLEKSFFKFKEVPYLTYLDAFREAVKSNKLVHCILLWGVLDDQSC